MPAPFAPQGQVRIALSKAAMESLKQNQAIQNALAQRLKNVSTPNDFIFQTRKFIIELEQKINQSKALQDQLNQTDLSNPNNMTNALQNSDSIVSQNADAMQSVTDGIADEFSDNSSYDNNNNTEKSAALITTMDLAGKSKLDEAAAEKLSTSFTKITGIECKPGAFLKTTEEKLESTAKSMLPTPTPFKNITDK